MDHSIERTSQYETTKGNESVDRRNFLKILALTASAAGAASARYIYNDSRSNELGRDNKESELVHLPSGANVGVILGFHDDPNHLSDVTVNEIEPSDIYQPAGGIFLDLLSRTLDYKKPYTDTEIIAKLHPLASETESKFLHKIIPYALFSKPGVPIIIGDISNSTQDKVLAHHGAGKLDRNVLTTATGASAGIAYVTGILADHIDTNLNEQVSRRSFITNLPRHLNTLAKAATTPLAILTGYLSSQDIVFMAKDLGIDENNPKVIKQLEAIISDLIHPERYAVMMRNIVWALKCTDLYESGEIEKEKVINIIGGARHHHVNIFLENPNLAKMYWKAFGYTEAAKQMALYAQDISWVYKSVVFDPSQKQTKTIEHKNLKELIQ